MTLLLKILTDLRAILALSCFVLGVGWYADHAGLAGKLTIASARAEHEGLRASAYQSANFEYVARIQAQERRIAELVDRAEALRVELSKKSGQFEVERAGLRRKLAELPPLPQDCEAAVRAAAKQIQGMVGR